MRYLVDSNVLLDIFEEDTRWYEWSSSTLSTLADEHTLVINSVVYAEVSIGFESIEDLDSLLPSDFFVRADLPWEACFLAGKCFMKYKKRGGGKGSPLPDFFIGAHAAVAGMGLVTRDKGRYQSYFPSLNVISPS